MCEDHSRPDCNIRAEHLGFWDFLCKQIVVVPQVQRDYAQGRVGKEELRQKFLASFYSALCGSPDEEGVRQYLPLELDFVYGSERGLEFEPLDGQQRLTTAWLLCWYLSWKSHSLVDKEKTELTDYAKVLLRFQYRTRKSTADFCRHLVEDGNQINVCQDGRLDDAIMDQTWFCNEWKYDPSIDAMLRMLSGSREMKDGVYVYLDDSIDKVFSKSDASELLSLIKNGRRDSDGVVYRPIMLWRYPLRQAPAAAADLYVKMNARGKPLSNFENFKADLSAFVKKYVPELDAEERNPEERFSHKMDVKWTNFFWGKRSHSPVCIDEIYFAFLNRFCLVKNAVRGCTIAEVASDLGFRFLYGEGGDDQQLVYKSFNAYDAALRENDACLALEKVLDGLVADVNVVADVNASFHPPWDVSGEDVFCFVPEYRPNCNKPERVKIASTVECLKFSQLTQKDRIAFGAFCRFFEKYKGDDLVGSLADWKRVVWNVVENSSVDNVNSMISGLRFFEKIGEHCDDIVSYLGSEESAGAQNQFSKEQVCEERQKAKKMKGERGDEWRVAILKAERHHLLRGNISSIFDEQDSLDDFKKKVELFYSVFPEGKRCDDGFYKRVCRILVGFGDCSLRRGLHRQFPLKESVFVERLRERDDSDDFKESLKRMLAEVGEKGDLSAVESSMEKDLECKNWQYYCVKYSDSFLFVGDGYYNWNDQIEFPKFVMMTTTLRGKHCNPFLLAICTCKRLRDDELWMSSKGNRDERLMVTDRIRLSCSDAEFIIDGLSDAEKVKVKVDLAKVDLALDKEGRARVGFAWDVVAQGCDLIDYLQCLDTGA